LVEVEVTESVALGRGRDHVRQALVALSDAGVRISLDDFGTGYASLTNVKQLPICALKIDRSFISGLGKVADDSIVHAMATLCTRMGLSIVAEGVETARQIEILRQFGVHYGQGLYFSHAVPSDDLGELTGISASGGWAPARICSLGEGLG
jgi:EAL domain-containing protein (putative c-di-GMP-specific phosphodiesterase class I)